MTEKDITNFSSSSSSPHRLPTRSASQALQNLQSTAYHPVSTSLRSLDAFLQGRDPHSDNSSRTSTGGISRSHLTEIYGPPGVGKTTMAVQVSANALHSGDAVVWMDSSHSVPGTRLKSILTSLIKTSNPQSSALHEILEDYSSRFLHFDVPTLPHLLALIMHSPASFLPHKTALIVIDSISLLLTLAFPKVVQKTETHKESSGKGDAGQWSASRKWAVMSDLVSRLGKLATTRNIGILLISQTTTRIKMESETMLHQAISSSAWDNGINTRILLFRDWLQRSNASSGPDKYIPKARFLGVMKAGGIRYDNFGKIIPFIIKEDGLEEIESAPNEIKPHESPIRIQSSSKRKRQEVGDSQSEEEELGSDEEYGWAGDEGYMDNSTVLSIRRSP